MVSAVYLESEGQVFESRCKSLVFCERCYRMYMRHMTSITVDLSRAGSHVPDQPTPPTTPPTPVIFLYE